MFILIQKLLPVLMKADSFFSEELYRSLVPLATVIMAALMMQEKEDQMLILVSYLGARQKNSLFNRLFFAPFTHLI